MGKRYQTRSFRTSTRRQLLVGIGAIGVGSGAASMFGTGALVSSNADRAANVSAADDENAAVAFMINDPVQKNKQERLVDLENNTSEQLDFTVTLSDCSQGTLYGPNGSGCSVTLSIGSGGIDSVDIEAAVKDTTIQFTIQATGTTISVDATRETTAVSGNTTGAINFKHLKNFVADTTDDNWTIEKIDIRDADGDNDLSSIEFEVTDSSGTTRASETVSCGCNGGSKYSPNGNPAVTLSPDDTSYTVQSGEQFDLRVTAYDADGNSAFETRQTTA